MPTAASPSAPIRCGSPTTCGATASSGTRPCPLPRNDMTNIVTAHLDLPAATADLRRLALGTVVYLNGRVFTGRERVYQHAIEDGAGMPASREALGRVNFHCSPAAAVNDDGSYTVGAVTATASF